MMSLTDKGLKERRAKVAAFHYCNGERDANRLAELSGLSARTLYRVAGDTSHWLYPVWCSEIVALGGNPDVVNFRVRPRGKQVDSEKQARVFALWQSLSAESRGGISRRELAQRLASEVGGLTLHQVVGWLRKFEKEAAADHE